MWNVYGVVCDTWDDACRVAGIETNAQLAAEDAYWAAEDAILVQDQMEARGGPVLGLAGGDTWHHRSPALGYDDDEIPF